MHFKKIAVVLSQLFPPWWGLDIFWKHTMAYVSQINFAFCPKALKLVEFQLLFFVITTAKIK